MFCLVTAPLLSWIFVFVPHFIIWHQSVYIIRVEFVWLCYFVLFESRKGHRGMGGIIPCTFLFVCSSWPQGSRIGSAVRSRQFLTFPLLGSQLVVGRGGFFPCFQINCTSGPAKLHAFRFGSRLRSPAQLLNPLQTTGQMMACGDSESFISLLFLTSLESRNHRRKPIISKWVFWVFRVKRAQEKEKKKRNWC